MRLYRAMSKEELNKTKDGRLNFRTKNKWFTPSFRFLIKLMRKSKYDAAIAIETQEINKFKSLNKKEMMIHCNNLPRFKLLWIKNKKNLLD